jgi:hypothetical protein
MRFPLFSFVVAALSVQQAVSLPFNKRNNITPTETLVLELAMNLENLEVAFYTSGLAQFSEADFAAANLSALVYRRYQEILGHEQTHAQLLGSILGPNAPQPCNYSFPFNSVQTFVNLSLVFESVGASAYTGALQSLSTPAVVTAAGAILSTEARQSSWVGTAVVGVTPWGTAFETPINGTEAFTLASGFIVSCPSTNPSLGLQAFPTFNITGTPIPGQNVSVQLPSTSANATFVAFSSGLDVQFVAIDTNGNVVVPQNVSGQVYAIATSSGSELSANTAIAGPAILLVETNSNGTLIN